MEFSRQEHWSGSPFPFPDLPTYGSNLGLLHHGQIFYHLSHCSVQFSRVRLCYPMDCQASLSITNSQSLLKLMFIMSVIPSNHLILRCPLILPPPIFPSISIFSNEWVLLIRWPKYWSFSFSISPSNEYSGLISFRTDWFDLLAVQGSLKILLQHHSSKHQFFGAQLLYRPTVTSIHDHQKNHSFD